MRYINYNDIKISKLSLGTVQFGLDYGIANSQGKPSQNKVDEIINCVTSQGLNCFDTAMAYGNSEEVLGKSLQDINNKLIISKITSELFEEIGTKIKTSLNNLQVDNLFALLLHNADALYNWDEQNSTIANHLKSTQQINYFGVSIYTNEEFNLALENENINIIQIPFNLFDQRAISKQWLKKAKVKNKLIFIRSVYLQGLLLMDKKSLPKNLKIVEPYIDILDTYSKKLNLSRNELALSYVNTLAKDSIILFGCETLKQAKENLDIFSTIKELDIKTIDELNSLLKDISEYIYNPSKWENEK